MARGHVLYNPKAGNGNGQKEAEQLRQKMTEELVYHDVTQISDYAQFFAEIPQEDFLVIAGGDGTLNRFANDTADVQISQQILYFPSGTGNDFAREMGVAPTEKAFEVTKYLKDLPMAEIKGKRYHFINGVGFGIDGYCCEVGDELRKIPGKKVDYTAIAIKGLLFHYNPTKAKITVDGQTYEYDNVWLAPTMFGKHYGGGMIPTPQQTRDDPEQKLSVMVFRGRSRLLTLCIFPSIFKGQHVKHNKKVFVHSGHHITVEFDSPRSLQVDGETILDVTGYTACSAKCLAETKETATV